MSRPDWLDRHHNAARKLHDDAQQLRNLAQSFGDVGNDTMWRILSALSFSIEESAKEMQDAVGSMIMEEVNRARESSVNMVKAALMAATETVEKDE